MLIGYHDHLVNDVSAAGPTAVSASSDYTVGLWDLSRGSRVGTLRGHDDDVEAVVLVDDALCVSASRDHTARVWDLQDRRVLHVLRGHSSAVLSVRSDGKAVYTSGDDGTLRVWSLHTGELRQTIGPFEVEADTIDVDPVGRCIAVGADDGVLRVYGSDGSLIASKQAHGAAIKKVRYSPNNMLVSAAYDEKILLWRSPALDLVAQLERPSAVWERAISWTVDGRSVLGGTFDGGVVRWMIPCT